jgi:hypothetical protein
MFSGNARKTHKLDANDLVAMAAMQRRMSGFDP